jgi:hypothetical protein
VAGVAEARSIYSGPIRRALENLDRKIADNGSTSVDGVLRNWNSAWGIVAKGSFTVAGSAVITNGTGITKPLTFAATGGRRYHIVLTCRAVGSDAAGSALNTALWKNGTAITGDQGWWRVINVWDTRTTTEIYEPATSETATWQFVGSSLAGTAPQMWGSGPSHFYIEDLGPVSPSLAPPSPPATAPTWTVLPLTAGWTGQSPSHVPQYRKVGDEVQVRGSLGWGYPSFGGNPIATFPVGFRPGRTEANSTALFMSNGGIPIPIGSLWGPRLAVETNGVFTVIGLNQTVPGYLVVDSIRFSVTP